MATKEVVFYYDLVCPYAYVASIKLQRARSDPSSYFHRADVKVQWRPVLLGGIYQLTQAPQGKAGSATNVMNDQKRMVVAKDLRYVLERNNILLNYHPRHPIRSVEALRLLLSVSDEDRPLLTRILYEAYWVDNLDIDDTDFLLATAERNGIVVPKGVFEDERWKTQLKQNTEEVVARGAPGVPAFYVNNRLFWGQDRFHFVEKALGNPHPKPLRLLPSSTKATKPTKFTFYFDFSSPWSYVGWTQVERLAAEGGTNVTLEYVPILLGALFKEIGTPNVPMFAVSEARRAYISQDLMDWVNWWGIKLNWPSSFPLRTVLPLRVAIVDIRTVGPIYKAAWVDDRNIGEASVLKDVLAEAGFDAEALLSKADDESVKKHLRDNTTRAVKVGVCGVPSYQVNHGDVIWGQDHYETIQDLLAGWVPAQASL
eukprot:TRINITY_DN5885_c0_g1_i2.p1 TRINITY_DN5885_c0_g1~~TRINITY_DN5885_c0_g1_i2.p1  ORF type:complete len:441 (+),score=66.43 TRINITY_DN5885_c0_g1_i2:45-1325(+)